MSFDGVLFLKWNTYVYGSQVLSLDSELSTFYGQAHSSGYFSSLSPHLKKKLLILHGSLWLFSGAMHTLFWSLLRKPDHY